MRRETPPEDRSADGSGEAANQASKARPWKTALMLVVALVAVPLAVVLGAFLDRSAYVLGSIIVVVLSMVPFFASFERRRPQARELVTLAVMVALAVASRAAFAFVPSFKPMAGIVMVTGIALGASSGFLAGSLAAFVSNFIFGQGPWTPWQMLAFGLGGCLFGFLADRGVVPRGSWDMKTRILVSLAGGFYILLVGGPILDTSSLVWMVGSLSPESALAVYAAGAPFNAAHGLATFATIALVGNAILDRLGRLRTKYGMME